MADNAQRSQRIEVESSGLAPFQLGVDILSQHFRLANCKLGRGWAHFTGLPIARRCTVAERPETFVILHGKGAIHDDGAALVSVHG